MHLTVLAVGKRLPAWAEAASAEYLKRFPRPYRPAVKTVAATKSAPDPRQLEGAALLRAVPEPARAVVLDERGEAWTSRELAQRLADWQLDGRDVFLVIGGADGLDEAVLARADERWSLGPGTLPHALARVVVLEQLYRAHTIQSGHPYHRD